MRIVSLVSTSTTTLVPGGMTTGSVGPGVDEPDQFPGSAQFRPEPPVWVCDRRSAEGGMEGDGPPRKPGFVRLPRTVRIGIVEDHAGDDAGTRQRTVREYPLTVDVPARIRARIAPGEDPSFRPVAHERRRGLVLRGCGDGNAARRPPRRAARSEPQGVALGSPRARA